MIKVTGVDAGSIAEELGLRPGTDLVSVNGRELEDFLDWEFLTAEDQFFLHVRQPDGEEIEFDIERPAAIPLGLSLEPARIRRCANRCDFCFVDGLPEGLREVLYIRDDDYRLSFRYGNFATLTNLKERDVSGSSNTGSRRSTSRCTPPTRSCAAGCFGIPRRPTSWSSSGSSPVTGSGSIPRSCCRPA